MHRKKREPKTVVFDWLDEPLVIHPIGARPRATIERRFPVNPDTNMVDDYTGFKAAMIETTVTTLNGNVAFTEADLNAADFDDAQFRDLSNEVFGFLYPEKIDPKKNSPATNSPPSV